MPGPNSRTEKRRKLKIVRKEGSRIRVTRDPIEIEVERSNTCRWVGKFRRCTAHVFHGDVNVQYTITQAESSVWMFKSPLTEGGDNTASAPLQTAHIQLVSHSKLNECFHLALNALDAERDVLANPSVCPCVCPSHCGNLSKINACIVEVFPPLGRGMTLF